MARLRRTAIIRDTIKEEVQPELPIEEQEEQKEQDCEELAEEPEELAPEQDEEPAPLSALAPEPQRQRRPRFSDMAVEGAKVAAAIAEPVADDDDEPESIVGEPRDERFRRVAKYRTEKAVERIRMLRTLNGMNYAYTPEQVSRICSALRKEIDIVEDRLMMRHDDDKFTLEL